jgi:hypothetical protein
VALLGEDLRKRQKYHWLLFRKEAIQFEVQLPVQLQKGKTPPSGSTTVERC